MPWWLLAFPFAYYSLSVTTKSKAAYEMAEWTAIFVVGLDHGLVAGGMKGHRQ